MKKLSIRLFLFFVPIVVLLYCFPVAKRKLYAGLNETCANRSLWFYDRITSNAKPADIIFMGTSHTLNGIDDKLLDSAANGMNIVNFGQCSFGVNLYYAYLQEILKYKKPKHIFIEVRNEEDRYGHPVFPYIANNKDVLLEPLLFNRDYFKDNYNHIYYKMEIIRKQIFGDDNEEEGINNDSYGCRAIDDTVALENLNNAKANYKPESLSAFETWFYMSYPRAYYEKIAALCKANDIKISFVYMPAYAEPYSLPAEHKFYEQFGEIIMPPDSIFRNTAYWFDDSHLNVAGAKALSTWLVQDL